MPRLDAASEFPESYAYRGMPLVAELPPSIEEMFGPAPSFNPAGIVADPSRFAPGRGGPGAVLVQIAAALGKALIEFMKAVDAVGQIASLISKIFKEIAWLIRRIISEEFVQDRVRAADTALVAIQYKLRAASFSPDPQRLLEGLYGDVQGAATALAKYEDLNTDRDGLGLAGYLATASLELQMVLELIHEKSPLVNEGTLRGLRDIHRGNAERAYTRARTSFTENYQLCGGWHGWLGAEDPRYQPVSKDHPRALEKIDWDAEHPTNILTNAPWKLYLGVMVRDRNEPFGWTWADGFETHVVFRGQANAAVRSASGRLRALEEQKEKQAEAALEELVGGPMRTLFAAWDRLKP